jgi:FdrA protein
MTRHVELRSGAYVDSVTLMQVSRRVASLPGVESAIVAMATDLNLELAAGMGFEVPADATPNKMLVAVNADTEDSMKAAVSEVEVAIAESSRPAATGFGSAPPPLTIRAAARASGATVAMISTPGQHAFTEAIDAVDAGLHTMVFSDNVPLEQEVALKKYAERAGVLVMGPDCGTAVIGGVGLGFANVVRPGPVGIVAASGTGAQHLMTLLAQADVGVSHCLGVGGRDLSEAVGGLSTIRALDLLADDEATEVIVVVSKPPAASVTAVVRRHAESLGKPVVFGLLGRGQPDLTDVASQAAAASGRTWTAKEDLEGLVDRGRSGGYLLGLYAGGTLCDEAMVIASAQLGPVTSNIPLEPDWMIGDDLASTGHTMIDFGDDRLTRGRPHPMIDGSIRADRLRDEVKRDSTGVVLLDVVLGLGASGDPAGELADPVAEATAAGVPVVVAMVGTADDPQGLDGQVRTLQDAGAWVCWSNAAATERALTLLETSDGAHR